MKFLGFYSDKKKWNFVFYIFPLLAALVYFISLFILHSETQSILLVLLIFGFLIFFFFLFSHYISLIVFSFILPICATGFLPPLYREIVYIFVIISAIAYIFIKRIEGEKLIASSHNFLSRYLKLLFISIVISFVYALLRGWFYISMLRGIVWFLEFMLLIIIIPSIIDKSKKIQMLSNWLLIGFLVSGIPFIFISINYFGKAVISIAGHVLNLNAIGMLLAPTLVFCFGLMLDENKKQKSLFFIVTLIVLLVNLLLTKSRGAWLGAIAGLTYIIIKTKSYKWFFYILTIVVVFVLFQNFQSILLGRVKQTSLVDPALISRLYIWKSAFSMLKSYFLTGVGIHNFPNLKYLYGFPRWLDPIAAYYTHNLFMEFLVGTGILGFVSFISLLMKTMKRMHGIVVKATKYRGFIYGINGALIAYLVHGLFDYCFWFSPALMLLAWYLGIAVAVFNEQRDL